jgi:acyl-CoA thioester hydrolase
VLKPTVKAQRILATEMDITVRMYDIDFNGHVSNIVYVRWLEDMRMVGFEKIVPLQACLDKGQVPLLVRTDIRYKRAVKMFDKPKGTIWIAGFRKASFVAETEISVDGAVCADATQTIVFINEQSGKLIRLPEAVLSRFEELEVPRLAN